MSTDTDAPRAGHDTVAAPEQAARVFGGVGGVLPPGR